MSWAANGEVRARRHGPLRAWAAGLLLFASSFLSCGIGRHASRPLAPNVGDAGQVAQAAVDAGVAPKLAASAHAGSASVPEFENDPRFSVIDAPIEAAIAEGKMPGCVVVIGRHDEVLYRRAYGSRSILPERSAMTLDTVFDLASLTKPVATATSVMILVERGAIDLDAYASKYVSELAKLPPFTVRQLLLHTSGLPAANPMGDYGEGRAGLMRHIGEAVLKTRPGERFVYSDVGFIVLDEIVRRVSGSDLAAFTANEIFEPLGMTDTGYLPTTALRARAAPTEVRDGAFIQGDVHDPRAWALGGVAGNAGVFSTGDDLARFARAMLNRGELDGHRIFAEKTFETLTTRRDTSSGGRGLGWDIDSKYASHKGTRMSPHAFGHGGFTGTAMWIDPDRDLFVVFLSNRVHPDGKGAVNPVIGEIATSLVRATEVNTGIDVLKETAFARLAGAKVGLVTNASAKTRDGMTTIDALRTAHGVTLKAIFSPEHGLRAEKEGAISDTSYAGVPVYSLYGERSAPSSSTLDGIDTLVFDLQDVGVRFYTYASTMKRAMKVASDRGMRFVVLDRPDPLDGVDVEGPMLTPPATGAFVNHHALPVRHGMTMGELARLFADDERMSVKLEIVALQNWRRRDYFDRTGLSWGSPSPNLRNVRGTVLYPMLGLLEGTNLSVGRGTDEPFEIFGAPWLDEGALAARLDVLGIPGVSFEPTTFTPTANPYARQKCHGLRVKVTDRTKYKPVRAALGIALGIQALHPREWEVDHVDRLLQSEKAMAALKAGKDVSEIESTWEAELAAFREKRETFLLYR
ncbi:exo-beta-N-acetylmuramidase NamZ domain-containing protein [Labilithrix luteola]|nr:exo-beta-N-acetylmuramidase NamZ domain-containing protein [Labilithrix luteola]